MNLKSAFIDRLLEKYPGLGDQPRSYYEEKISDQLFSPFVVRLPKHLKGQIQSSVSAFYHLRNQLASTFSHPTFQNPGNVSIMSSYDFHIDSQSNLKLIEVNTNAAFLILGWEMYQLRGLPHPGEFSPEIFRKEIEEELLSWKRHQTMSEELSPQKLEWLATSNVSTAIVDDKPDNQRLFIEFLVAREWLRSFGWTVSVRDTVDAMIDPAPNFIYNRDTDFLLERDAAQPLRQAFLDRNVCVSPNPFEYLLMADKQRLVDWSQPSALEKFGLAANDIEQIRKVLPMCYDVSKENADEIWGQRKSLFIKPKREFGSKKAFKGASISRKLFDEIVLENPLAQEYIPAPEQTFETPAGPQSFKFDLRCHAYKDRLDGVVARLYQGQVTNLKTQYGGFAPVVFE